MLLVRTNWDSFGAYLKALNKPARKNYKAVMKQYAEVNYAVLLQGEFPTDEVRHFMSLWERQLIRGKTVQWAFPVEHIKDLYEQGNIKLFKALKNGEVIAVHFIQKRDGYWECHPPMYDKTLYPSLAKWMWFFLVRHAILTRMEHLDFGGGVDNWREMIRRRAEFPNPQYKWVYVPERAKLYPETEPDYYIERPSCKLLLRG